MLRVEAAGKVQTGLHFNARQGDRRALLRRACPLADVLVGYPPDPVNSAGGKHSLFAEMNPVGKKLLRPERKLMTEVTPAILSPVRRAK
ncbi:hypothetical protein SBA3_540017 [Candidatus Sulfopaludibacter sp. SbA3]|nr:hypothetical protein SBA3_540017 [Candidatus Sulfopaludibacter sp. SbA3]